MPQIITIVGPTAVGKSAVAMEIARQLNGVIIGADAMQIYQEVSIACDKPSFHDRQSVPHRMVDVASVRDEYDVAQYAKGATQAIEEVLGQGKVPIIVGGSGMYVSVLLDGIFDGKVSNDELRDTLLERASTDGPAVLHAELAVGDPVAAAKIHPNDARRIVRALEIFQFAGKPISQLQGKRAGIWGKYDIKVYGLTRERCLLYATAETRIDAMFANGLVDEIKRISVLPPGRTAAAMIGVKEVRGYLQGEYGLERARYLLKLNTRHYIKRQLTWFRRDSRIHWIDATGKQSIEIAQNILSDLKV